MGCLASKCRQEESCSASSIEYIELPAIAVPLPRYSSGLHSQNYFSLQGLNKHGRWNGGSLVAPPKPPRKFAVRNRGEFTAPPLPPKKVCMDSEAELTPPPLPPRDYSTAVLSEAIYDEPSDHVQIPLKKCLAGDEDLYDHPFDTLSIADVDTTMENSLEEVAHFEQLLTEEIASTGDIQVNQYGGLFEGILYRWLLPGEEVSEDDKCSLQPLNN